MPRNTPRFTRDLHALLTDEQYEFLTQLNGGIGHHVRQMIDASMGKYDKDLATLQTRLAAVEPEYFALKKRIEELKEAKKREEDEMMDKDRRVEDAHNKLLEMCKKSYHSRVDLVPKNYFKVYADMSGETVAVLKDWLEKEIAKSG